ncbi:hypothetical protein DQW77_08595 [Roseovarius sp. TE539]|uniref:hypothetical protein n=1 Tax=Roseovarius sp. TE539 TaxID=2249812 RepID=UPI000DE0C96C|nr:hypothetical protein [Roseovarius sp. TE539]RBI74032.1 hypothetical protein DQW77_08595 [Roseovarius sp. TE539]
MAPRPDPKLADGFLKTARQLIPRRQKPDQAGLRRSISSSYYAMFHALARLCADGLLGTQPAKRSNKAWVEVYRGLAHGECLQACQRAHKVAFPQEIKDFTDSFQQLLTDRERADYDPTARFSKEDALKTLGLAEAAVAALQGVSMRDRRAFAAWVLITSPGAQKARKQA